MAEAENPSEKVQVSSQRPRLRPDLRIVYENPAAGKGQIRIVDPRSGRQYSFDEREHVLCQAADGSSDVAAIQSRLAQETGAEMTVPEVKEFFRRLQILGLLEPEAAEQSAGAAPRPFGAKFPRNEGGLRGALAVPDQKARPGIGLSSGLGVGLGSGMSGGLAARRGRGPIAGATGTATKSDGRLQLKAKGRNEAEAPAEARTPASEPDQPPEAQTADDTVLRLRPDQAVKESSASGASSRRSGGRDAAAAEAQPASPDAPANTAARGGASVLRLRDMRQSKSTAGRQKAVPDAAETATEDAGGTEPPAGGAARSDTRPPEGERPADPTQAVPEFDFFDEAFDDIDSPASGMRGGMGGFRGPGGGMGGMGGMGAAFGGMGGMGAGLGGMGAGLGGMGGGMGGMGGPNRERIMAALAGRGGMGGMGGGPGMGGMGMGGMGMGPMAGGMRPQAAAAPGEHIPGQVPIFNPEPLLRVLYILFYPLKFVLWAIVPLVLIAGLSLLNNMQAASQDFYAMTENFGDVVTFILSVAIVNVISRLAMGVAIVGHGGRVKSFGIFLELGIILRFYADRSGIPALDRRGQLWAHGAPLLARLACFAVGTLTWAVTREQGGLLPQVALVVAQFGLTMFVTTACPLVPSDGMRWVATFYNEPRLLGKAAMVFNHVFRGRPLPPIVQKKDVLPLALFAVGTIITMVGITGVIAVVSFMTFEEQLGGLGVVIFLGFAAAFVLWFASVWAMVKAKIPAGAGMPFDREAFREMALGRSAAAAAPDVDHSADAEASQANVAKAVWTFILAALLIVAFLPYTYESGGQVEIQPVARGQAVARTDGEIVEVMVREGDAVRAGQVMARLSSWDEEAEIESTRASLAGAQAQLNELLAGAKPEEIEVAQRQVEAAEASVNYSRSQAQRARELADNGAQTQQQAEQAESNLQSDLANLAVSQANLALVQSPATADQIAAAESQVDKLTHELAFREDELARTRIVAPIDGRVVTSDLQLLQGSFLRSGDTLLEIERTEVVSATIGIPESDITLLSPSRPVRLKVFGHSGDEIPGSIQSIAPAAEDLGYGRVVRVTAVFPNGDGFLKSGMTGYAKIEGAHMRVWEAYMRSIVRFFQIEVWSWIP